MTNRHERRKPGKTRRAVVGPDDWPDMLESIVKLANENMQFMDGTTDPLFEIMDKAEIVFAVWQDASQQHGVGYRVVKGHELLQMCMAKQRNLKNVKWTGIPCNEEEHAMALEQVYAERTMGPAH